MAYKKKARKRKTNKTKKSRPRKPIGFVKQGKGYKFVFGSKSKPRLGTKKYTKNKLMDKYKKSYLKK